MFFLRCKPNSHTYPITGYRDFRFPVTETPGFAVFISYGTSELSIFHDQKF